MKRGIAKAERNGSPSLTLPIKTRTPLEAFNLLRQGHPIDQAIGYYDGKDMVTDEIWMLDKVAKLHKLAEFRGREAMLSASIKEQESYINSLKQLEENERQRKQQSDQGQVQESRTDGQSKASGGSREQPL